MMALNGRAARNSALRGRIGVFAFLAVLLGAALPPVVQAGPDYIPEAPPTVYEDPTMSPQTMDYDTANKTFIAHPGWIRDKLIHYYKFRMFTPDTYPNKVKPGVAPDIPIGEVYLLTTTGDFSGTVADQKPIVRWHTADGENYSDFVEVVWAEVGPGYEGNTYKSHGDLVENDTMLNPSGIYANMPVVPLESRLQDPSGTGFAPILPLLAWYRGVEVQTFVFETTSQAFADHFNPLTRTGTAAQAGSGYEITVRDFVFADRVTTIPIWHLNQYWVGVQEGVNSGGPWGAGQRNIIDLDRGDPGYSPLWQVFWVSKVPVDYSADEASSASQITEANGFEVLQTPMYVNCPDVGPMGGGVGNPNKAASFGRSTVSPGESVRIAGALVMQAGVTIEAFVGGAKVATTQTAMMGGYAFDLSADRLVDGSNTIVVRDGSGNTLQTLTITKAAEAPSGLPGYGLSLAVVIAVAAVVAVLLLLRRRRGGAMRPSEDQPEERGEETNK